MLTKKNLWFLILSFTEGAALMVVELAGGKLMAPYYGQTLYVWTAILGTTLGGLALGYFLGGWLSVKWDSRRWVYPIIILCGALLFFMPQISTAVMDALIEIEKQGSLGLRSGIFLSTISYLLLPVMFCGMVSPLIIDQIKDALKESGRAAGIIYAISTTGGILATYLVSYYFFPYEGIRFTCMLFGSVLAGFGVLSWILVKPDMDHG